jgi:hypothetical protein
MAWCGSTLWPSTSRRLSPGSPCAWRRCRVCPKCSGCRTGARRLKQGKKYTSCPKCAGHATRPRNRHGHSRHNCWLHAGNSRQALPPSRTLLRPHRHVALGALREWPKALRHRRIHPFRALHRQNGFQVIKSESEKKFNFRY